MLAIGWITWWYSAGWKQLCSKMTALAGFVVHTFSVPLLLRTLFAPWRRIISYGDDSFIAGLRAGLDNLISRFVGFGVRVIVLLTSLLALITIATVGIFTIILWPLLPFLGVFLILNGLFL